LALVVAHCGSGMACSSQDEDAHVAFTAEVELIAAHRQLVEAYQLADTNAAVALLDSTPDLLIFHPAVESRFDGIDEVRRGLTRMFGLLGPAIWTEVHTQAVVRENVGWITANLVVEAPDAALVMIGRGTEIWTLRNGAWKLAHAHWSASPETVPD
jgi:ketosteroid isomerase-like protein